MQTLTVNTDGGARGNPGPAAIGAVVYNERGEEVQRLSRYLGVATNNQAEYQALVMALEWIEHNYGQAQVYARLDSELVVRQLNGEYKMKNVALKPWFERVREVEGALGAPVRYTHVPRAENKLADQLVNEALDKQLNVSID